jgi:hypothetical protein
MDYRKDFRTDEQFIQDIEKGNARERLAISLFKSYLKRTFGECPIITENGCDMSGAYIDDLKQVSTESDYKVGKNGLSLEVKTSVGHTREIYLKVKQLDSYIKQGASILFVQGIESDFPAFTLWTLEDLKYIRRTTQVITPPKTINGGKQSVKVYATDWEFHQFNGKVRKYDRY